MSEIVKVYGSDADDLVQFPDGLKPLLHLITSKRDVSVRTLLSDFLASCLCSAANCNIQGLSTLGSDERLAVLSAMQYVMGECLLEQDRQLLLGWLGKANQ